MYGICCSPDDYFFLYRISYMWYVVIGFVVTLFVGLLVSSIVTMYNKKQESVPDPDLFVPFVRRYLKKKYDLVLESDDTVSISVATLTN